MSKDYKVSLNWLMRVCKDQPEITLREALEWHDEMMSELHDPQAMAEHEEQMLERELESDANNVRAMGGDYWQNDAGEWCCG